MTKTASLMAVAATGAASFALVGPAAAQEDGDAYIAVGVGAHFLQDSDNTGSLSEALTVSGSGTDADGVVFGAGTDLSWQTEFDTSVNYSAAIGKRRGPYRFELEVAYASNDVDNHSGLVVGGVDAAALDAAALVGGVDTPLGVSVGDALADGRGDIQNVFLFVNAYYDFPISDVFVPYVGAGIGAAFTDVTFQPSDIGVLDDDDTRFAYQVAAGASFAATEQIALFGEIAYRGTPDVDLETALFPGELTIENRGILAEVGLRFAFGGY